MVKTGVIFTGNSRKKTSRERHKKSVNPLQSPVAPSEQGEPRISEDSPIPAPPVPSGIDVAPREQTPNGFPVAVNGHDDETFTFSSSVNKAPQPPSSSVEASEKSASKPGSPKGKKSKQSPLPAQQLDQLVEKTHRTLFMAKTVFPFDFFQDTIRIDENKVDIITSNFFLIKHMFSILIKNINGCTVSTGVFFASLTIEVTGYETNPDPVDYLWRHDAVRARRIILGLVACQKEGIDVSKIPKEEAAMKIEEIGRAYEHKNV